MCPIQRAYSSNTNNVPVRTPYIGCTHSAFVGGSISRTSMCGAFSFSIPLLKSLLWPMSYPWYHHGSQPCQCATRAYQYSDQGENVISDESERRALMQYFIRNGQILMQITMQMPYRVMNRSAWSAEEIWLLNLKATTCKDQFPQEKLWYDYNTVLRWLRRYKLLAIIKFRATSFNQ